MKLIDILQSMDKGSHLDVGRVGEGLAARFVERRGWRIVERNYRVPFGEIDIIAQEETCLHFIEVKTVSREKYSQGEDVYRPEELVHEKKLNKIRKVAEFYLVSREISGEGQVDVVVVHLNQSRKTAQCTLIENV